MATSISTKSTDHAQTATPAATATTKRSPRVTNWRSPLAMALAMALPAIAGMLLKNHWETVVRWWRPDTFALGLVILPVPVYLVWLRCLVANWRLPLALLAIASTALLALYLPTLESMVAIWWRSDTFAHGFLILPISVYLIWLKRRELARLQPQASLLGLATLTLGGVGWLAASLVDVQVVQQFALVGMLIAMTWTILGWPVVRTLLFPLGFLLFMVPIGEFLIPPMMEFTAVFSVALIRMTDIPVYWEGLFISLPSGDWSIVEGCSGVRYLIASLAVGFLYAYLFYHSFWRRAAFVLLAIVTPIIANGFRAFMIIMIGHYSDMKLATGVDHLVYGWVFFGLVIMLMFWLGSFWWDRAPEAADTPPMDPARPGTRLVGYLWVAPLAFAVAFAAPLLLRAADRVSGDEPPVIPLPVTSDGWALSNQPLTPWTPDYPGPSATRAASYQRDGRQVDLFLFNYRDQSQGAELVNSQNLLVRQKTAGWHMRFERPSPIELHGMPEQAVESLLRARRGAQGLLVWNWYWIDGIPSTNPLATKLREAWQRLTAPERGGFAVVMATEVDDHDAPGHATLQAFVDAMWPAIETAMQQTR